jgi:glycosyltransferase involved in cell wall biosynthesis
LNRRGGAEGRVSVAVPLYNHAAYIEAAIRSILAQGRLVREIIVIDDGSSDDSARIMRKLAATDARIAFTSQANQGAHAALNTALAACQGEFVAILNSDDAYLPGRFEALVAALDAEPEAALCASTLAFMDAAGAAIGNPWYAQALAGSRAAPSLAVALIDGNFLMTTSNFLLRRSALAALGGFAPLRYAHDLDFALRLLASGQRILLVQKPLMRYRIHAANTISEDHRRVRAEWAICAASYYSFLLDRRAEIDWPLAAALEDVLRRHELTKAVHLVMAYLRRDGTSALDRSRLLADQAFLRQLAGWV